MSNEIKLEITVDLSESAFTDLDKEETEWFESEVIKDNMLMLFSNEIGDELGLVTKVKIIKDE